VKVSAVLWPNAAYTALLVASPKDARVTEPVPLPEAPSAAWTMAPLPFVPDRSTPSSSSSTQRAAVGAALVVIVSAPVEAPEVTSARHVDR
jgi:hypothetical protein